MAKTNVYVLQLEDGCYYVGKTNNVEERFKQHCSGDRLSWTKKHRPIAIMKVYQSVSSFEEDRITKEYMTQYGINKVRGGVYASDELDPKVLTLLKKEIWGVQDGCVRCGRVGHSVNDCYATTDIEGESLVISCGRCGRNSHTIESCYSTFDIDGRPLGDDDSLDEDSDSHSGFKCCIS